MEDILLICKTCRHEFVWTKKDQTFYEEMGYKPPMRCKPCRRNKNQMYLLRHGLQELSINDSRLAENVLQRKHG